MSAPKERPARTRDLVENYQSTVHAMLAFTALVVHDGTERRAGSAFGFGRRMSTSASNAVAPKAEVTPDIVAQKSRQYGIAGELKRSLERDEAHWASHLTQLRKYDDDLIGWWNHDETISAVDAALVIHHSRSRAFVQWIQAQVKLRADAVGSRSSVVEFGRSNEAEPYVFFRLEWGAVSDTELARRLNHGVQVPIARVLQSFPTIKFCDAPPPPEYILTLLWTDLFATLAADGEYDEKLRAIPLEVSVAQVTGELQRAYGSGALTADSRSASFPKKAWVHAALEVLAAAKVALRSADPDKYTVLYRTLKGDVLDRLRAIAGQPPAEEADDGRQLPLDLAPPAESGE